MTIEQEKNWISCRDMMPGYYARVYLGTQHKGDNNMNTHDNKPYVLSENGFFFNPRTYEEVCLRVITHWRYAEPVRFVNGIAIYALAKDILAATDIRPSL